MPRSEPAWWYSDSHQFTARCLAPVGWLYGAVAVARFKNIQPYRAKLPVICVGNFTAGGTGKTPFALHIAERLKSLGAAPVFLTRGYGGSVSGPLWVDPAVHTANEIGDEPLLLARAAPALVARDRRAGAEVIEALGNVANVIVMDDGLQNPSLTKDLSIAIVDSTRGIGNRRIIPAGPLRAPLAFQMELCDAIVLNGPASVSADPNSLVFEFGQDLSKPLLHASVEPEEDTGWLKGARVIAFAGIGHPQRFFDLVVALGAQVIDRVAFRDHQTLSEDDARSLLANAKLSGATLITTEKDWVRLPQTQGQQSELKQSARVLAVRSVLDPESAAQLDRLLRGVLSRR